MIALIALFFACSEPPPPPAPEPPKEDPAVTAAKALIEKANRVFAVLPKDMSTAERPVSAERVALGKQLYFETRLSKNQDLSCNSCHLVDKYGVDGAPTSTGHKGQKGGRNAPTVYNAGLHLAQFWDGRAADLEAQAKGPILNPIEMAIKDEAAAVAIIKSIPGYEAMFKAAFPNDADPITYDNMAIAIGAYERTLVTPGPFDAFLAGDTSALNADQQKGLDTFLATGCASCHAGVAVGGGMYQKLGAARPWPDLKDNGRFDVTQNEADKGFFKVPSLRNIDKTGPYFHDGSVATLDDAVKKMGAHQLGKDLTDAEVASIVAFLGSLTGPLPAAEVITAPAPLESGPKTPKPNPN